jgi:hypothetical protein
VATDLEKELQEIKKRNQRVELDKKWEVSYFRRISIALGTYLVCLWLLFAIGAQNPFLGATVPPIGYLISTLSLGFLKNWWLRSQ